MSFETHFKCDMLRHGPNPPIFFRDTLSHGRNLSCFFRDKLPIRLAIDSWICFMDPKKSRNLTKATGKQINVPLYQ